MCKNERCKGKTRHNETGCRQRSMSDIIVTLRRTYTLFLSMGDAGYASLFILTTVLTLLCSKCNRKATSSTTTAGRAVAVVNAILTQGQLSFSMSLCHFHSRDQETKEGGCFKDLPSKVKHTLTQLTIQVREKYSGAGLLHMQNIQG